MLDYLTIEEVLALLPGFTRQGLAQLRYKGQGPAFMAPTPRKIYYSVKSFLVVYRFPCDPSVG
jgi:hypothetical protein